VFRGAFFFKNSTRHGSNPSPIAVREGVVSILARFRFQASPRLLQQTNLDFSWATGVIRLGTPLADEFHQKADE
jgi:hypothetical protein